MSDEAGKAGTFSISPLFLILVRHFFGFYADPSVPDIVRDDVSTMVEVETSQIRR
jgi:hypothetical protein